MRFNFPPCNCHRRNFSRVLSFALCLALASGVGASGVSAQSVGAQSDSAVEWEEAPEAWRAQSVASSSEAQRLATQKTNEALAAQINQLNEKRQWAQTEKLVEARWPQLLQEGVGRLFWILPSYLQALQKQGKADEAATVMRGLSALYIVKTGSWDGVWLSAWTAEALEQAGDNERALGWAKLSWMLCAHDEIQVRQSMQRLMRIWVANDLQRTEGLSFLRQQIGSKSSAASRVPLVGAENLNTKNSNSNSNSLVSRATSNSAIANVAASNGATARASAMSICAAR